MEQLVARQAHNLEVARSNPASATNNDITSCKETSYVVFLFYTATNLRQDRAKSQVYDVKNKTFVNFAFVKGRTLVISNITILPP